MSFVNLQKDNISPLAAHCVQVDTLAQFSQWQPIVSSKERAWTGVTVEQFKLTRYETPEHCYNNHGVFIQTGGQITVTRRVNGGLRQETYRRGDISILPMGFSCAGRAEVDEYLAIHLEPTLVERIAPDVTAARVELTPQLKLRAPFIANIGAWLLDEAASSGASGRLYAESLATALAVHLVRHYSSANPVIREGKGGLAPRHLRRVIEYIHDQLDRDVSLAALAETTDLSLFHFARQFKQAMGCTAHEYVIEQRIIHAQALLRTTTLPIAEIALRIGCANQQHFSTLFRRRTGITPTAYRAAC
jgi:AraC family transcriptional regulator